MEYNKEAYTMMDDSGISGYGIGGGSAATKLMPLVLNVAIVAGAILSLLFGYLAVFGYGTLHIAATPQDGVVLINRHAVTSQTLKLRPGSYEIVITSPLTDPYIATVHVGLFRTTDIGQTTTRRNPDAVASSILGAVNAAPVHMLQPRWFDNNTWLAGFLSPGNPRIALHYDASLKQWVVGYYEMSGYPNDISKLPTDVAGYINQLGAQYNAG